jgi:5-methylthioadenosine/S-adenosylhomocysteine deaminase
MDYDLLITNGLLKTPASPNPDQDTPSYLAIRAGMIAACGPMAELSGTIAAARTIDVAGNLVMPGLINSHNHCAMTLFRGLADDLPLQTWLQQRIFPAEAKFVSPEMVYWCTRLAAAEMILSGTTTVADGYFFEDDAARALKEAGLRGVAAQGVIDFPAPGVAEPAENLKVAARFIDRWRGDELIRPGVFCHSPYTCNAETIRQAKELARRTGCRFFIHVAETAAEVSQSRRQHGFSPVRYLDRLGVLDEGTVCVHCVWLDDDDIEIIRRSGAGVVSCPQSNMKLAAGIAPIDKLVAAAIPVGLGTDGCASNNRLDMFGEMAATAKLHKVNRLDPTLLPAGRVVAMATSGGATVLGLGEEIGTLAVGRRADLIIVDLAKPHLTPRYDADSLLAYAASGSDVKTSIVNGRVIMENYRLLTIDLAEVLARVNNLARQVRAATSPE